MWVLSAVGFTKKLIQPPNNIPGVATSSTENHSTAIAQRLVSYSYFSFSFSLHFHGSSNSLHHNLEDISQFSQIWVYVISYKLWLLENHDSTLFVINGMFIYIDGTIPCPDQFNATTSRKETVRETNPNYTGVDHQWYSCTYVDYVDYIWGFLYTCLSLYILIFVGFSSACLYSTHVHKGIYVKDSTPETRDERWWNLSFVFDQGSNVCWCPSQYWWTYERKGPSHACYLWPLGRV